MFSPSPTPYNSSAEPFAAHTADLATLASRGRLRSLRAAAGRDFASNDYLGIASSPRLGRAVEAAIGRGAPVGAGGSRLLRGQHPEHAALEQEAADFFGAETALLFSSGYTANVALLSTLPQAGDLVVYDALVHASAHDGLRLSRAESAASAHNDLAMVEDAIVGWRRRGGTGRAWIAVESLYSMDGDFAPLDALTKIADRHDAILLVDEAHATGVFGNGGRGLAADLHGRCNVITLNTCGKALGTEGALVCGPAVVRDFLINRGRGLIFSTAPSPLMAAATRESLRMLADEPSRRDTLWANVAAAERALAPHGVTPTGSHILPLLIGGDEPTMAIAAALQARGFDVRGIRPPTVAPGTSRLRISITANVSLGDIAALAAALGEVLQ
jgi:8-amino-7-oxononanoate synthase